MANCPFNNINTSPRQQWVLLRPLRLKQTQRWLLEMVEKKTSAAAATTATECSRGNTQVKSYRCVKKTTTTKKTTENLHAL